MKDAEKTAASENLVNKWLKKVPPAVEPAFEQDCLKRNVRRFSVLPYFNIIVQIVCVVIYLYIYPMTFPEKPHLDEPFFLTFTTGYIVMNMAALLVFAWLGRGGNLAKHQAFAKWAVYGFIFGYVCMEASQMVFELEISGNMYRFLATFFVVSFFPLIGRLPRLLFMALYIAISLGALNWLQYSRAVQVYSYPQIVVLVFMVCLVAANIYYSSIITNFELQMDLVEKNKQLEKLNDRLRTLSSTDSLTGLSNRRSLTEFAERSWRTALRSKGTIGVLMIDIDNFKRYNDIYGHQAGDECLEKVSACINSFFNRSIDMVARYGGEEFTVVLSHVAPENCVQMAEAVRQGVEGLGLPHSGNQPYGKVTLSVGVATAVPEIDEKYETLVKKADEALYAAKEDGRNQVRVAGAQ